MTGVTSAAHKTFEFRRLFHFFSYSRYISLTAMKVFLVISLAVTLSVAGGGAGASAGAGAMASARGEFCHAWRGARTRWRSGFHCPERSDSKEALLCCGRCDLRYCCGNPRDRLDQASCSDHGAAEQPDNNTEPHTADLPVYVPFLVVVCVFVAFLVLASVMAICFCLNQKPLTPQTTNPPNEAPSPTEPPPETFAITTSTANSCGSASSIFSLNTTPQVSPPCVSPLVSHNPILEKQRCSSPSYPPLPVFHRTMTLPTVLHPLMFPTGMLNPYMMPPRVYRSVPSPCPPVSGTTTMQRTREVIV